MLALRIWFGGALFFLHGMDKLQNFSEMATKFPNVFAPYLNVSPTINLSLAIGAEAVASACVVLGLFSRLSALACGFTMVMGFFVAHKAALSGPGNGELAFMYMGAFLAIFFAGPGRFSVDAVIARNHSIHS